MFLLLRKCIKEVNINQITYKYFKLYIDLGGGIGIVEMLKKTNILALVGGGRLPKYSKNKITIWDDHQGKIISQIRFNSESSNGSSQHFSFLSSKSCLASSVSPYLFKIIAAYLDNFEFLSPHLMT